MKKNRKKIIIVILLFSLYVISVFSYLSLSKKVTKEEIKTNVNSVIVANNISDTKIKIQKTLEIKPVVNQAASDVNINKIKISLEVLDKTYTTEVKDGSSIFDAMNRLEEENLKDGTFSFKYTEHLGLGAFVYEINGIKGTPGKYWIYYVNNTKASIGISNYVLKMGDIISWKQESF